MTVGFPEDAVVKNPPANTGGTRDAVLIPGSGRSPAGGNGNWLQRSLVGCSPWGLKELDNDRATKLTHTVTAHGLLRT